MSLNWDLTKIADYRTVCISDYGTPEAKLRGITEGMIWSTVAVGMGNITEKNAAEFYARIALHEQVHGAIMSEMVDGVVTPRPITAADVEAHIGLWTNVTTETTAKWSSRFTKTALKLRQREYGDYLTRKGEQDAALAEVKPAADGEKYKGFHATIQYYDSEDPMEVFVCNSQEMEDDATDDDHVFYYYYLGTAEQFLADFSKERGRGVEDWYAISVSK